jgi:hypothetical protein
MDRIFQIIFWTGSTDAAFASAVLGCVSFFLSVRVQMKERNRILEEHRKRDQSDQTD